MMWLFDLGLYSYYLFFYMAKLMLKSAILFPIKKKNKNIDKISPADNSFGLASDGLLRPLSVGLDLV